MLFRSLQVDLSGFTFDSVHEEHNSRSAEATSQHFPRDHTFFLLVSGVASFSDSLRLIPSPMFVPWIIGEDGRSLLVFPLLALIKPAPEQESDWGGKGPRVGSWLLKRDGRVL